MTLRLIGRGIPSTGRWRWAAWAILAAAFAIGTKVTAANPERVAWTTSRVAGSPEPPPRYRTVNLFPAVRLEHPVAVAMPPGDSRWWVAEQSGKLFCIDPEGEGRAQLVIDLKASPEPSGPPRHVDALYGLAFHPQFATNRQCFLAYTVVTGRGDHLDDGTRVSRFRVEPGAVPRIDPATEEIVITYPEGGHNGGCLAFGPDGDLYLSTGDAENPSPPDVRSTGPDISDLLASILRIDVDHDSGSASYSIPADNPFRELANARPEVWAYGFRNPWKMSFDRQTGALWVGDVGWELWEMVHRVERGGNYGWSVVEGRQPVRPELDPGPSPISPPILELPHTMAASITGGFVYRGQRFPELRGDYVFGDWETKRLWSWPTEPSPSADGSPPQLVDLVDPSIRVISFGEDHEGELVVLDYDAGTLHGFERNAEADAPRAPFPRTLSETGLFESVSEHRPATGIVPFQPTVEQWSDGAVAERWLGLPEESPIVWHRESVEIPGSMFRRHLDFPEGAVFLKTLSLPADEIRTRPLRVETQLLHYDGRQWRGYSYRWNESQTDADLVADSGDEADFEVEVMGAPENRRTLRWTFASRTQCLICHNPWAESTLAFNVDQLGRVGKAETSAWEHLCATGFVTEPGDLPGASESASAAVRSRLVDARDPSRPIDARARSYLHVNCSHCHRNGGGGSVQLELQIDLPQDGMKAVDFLPVQGSYGLDDARIVAAGDPFRSVLLYRMSKTGHGRMPHLGSEWPDDAAVDLLQNWIQSLGTEPESPSAQVAMRALEATRETPTALAHDVLNSEGAAASASVAFAISRMMDRSGPEFARQIGEPGDHPRFATRDLFTKYLPEPPADRVGTVIRPARILSREGNPERGKDLFWNHQSLNCKTCHRVRETGGQVGPDLTDIGARRPPAELLESLLDPSRSVAPQFATYAIETSDGRVLSGVIVRRDSTELELRDAKGEPLIVSAGEIEMLRPQRASLMPEGLLKDLTLDQAADLLAYLESLKP